MSLKINKKFFILAGETSGDYIGGSIIRGLKEKEGENSIFFGIGGSLMKEEGLRSLYEMKDFNIIGFMNTIYNYKKLNNHKNSIVKNIFEEKPDAIITIDTKGFSFALAKKLKNLFILELISFNGKFLDKNFLKSFLLYLKFLKLLVFKYLIKFKKCELSLSTLIINKSRFISFLCFR